MKRHALLILISLLYFVSCSVPEEQFSIIGTWGMVSGTITDGSGTTKRYGELGENSYYQYLEFKVDGTLVQTAFPEKTITYGVYSYNDGTKELPYKFDGDKYYYKGSINIISAREMILTTDYDSSGRITKYLVKLK